MTHHSLLSSQSLTAVPVNGQIMMNHKKGFMVKSDTGQHILAKVSLSCAFVPEVADIVHLTQYQDSYYITHIFERASDKPLKLHSAHGLHISASQRLSFSSEAIELTSNKTQMTQAEFGFIAQQSDIYSKDAKLLGSSFLLKLDSFVARLKTSFRNVEKLEHLSSGNLIQSIKNVFSNRSNHVDVQAKSDVKINGKRIHMG